MAALQRMLCRIGCTTPAPRTLLVKQGARWLQLQPPLAARGESHSGEHVAARAKDEILSRDRARGTPMQLVWLARSSASSVDTVSHTTKYGRRRPWKPPRGPRPLTGRR